MEALKNHWRRYGMVASLAAFCCVSMTSGMALAQVKFRRVGTVTTTINGQLCTNNGNDMVCDSTTPTISSGNVGIGTTSPLDTLTVNGTVGYMLGSDLTTTGSQNDVVIGTASALRYNGAGTATFTGIAAGANGQILYLHNPSAYTLTLSNQSASSSAANHIITGTGADLSVPSNTSVTMQYDATAALWRVTGSSNSANTLAAGSTGQVQFNGGTNLAADSNFFWDNTNKRLGIGTATPVSALHIQGNMQLGVSGADANRDFFMYSATSGQYLDVQTRAGFNALISTATPLIFSSTSASAYIALQTNSVERMRVNASGNLGIGTTTPTNILSLSGSAAQTFWMERNPTANTAGNSLTVESSGATSGATDKSGGNLILSSGIATGTGSSNILFQTTNAGGSGTTDRTPATAMTILGNGHVGIGMTPQYSLDVAGAIRNNDWIYAYQGLSDWGSTEQVGLSANTMTFKTAGSESMRIASGKVGIGTTTPVGLLTIYGAETIASGASVTLDDVAVPATTTTVTGTTHVTTAKGFNKVSLYQPTVTDASAVTIDNAATLYIDNAPQAAGSATITNAYALNVAAGTSIFGGNVGIGTTSTPTGIKAAINGVVQVAGTGSETCNSSTVGAMRYNAAGQYMEICAGP